MPSSSQLDTLMPVSFLSDTDSCTAVGVAGARAAHVQSYPAAFISPCNSSRFGANVSQGTILTALDNAWWHGPRIKVALPGSPIVDGVPFCTGWVSLVGTRGDYLLIPVVDATAAEEIPNATLHEVEAKDPSLNFAPGLRDMYKSSMDGTITDGPRIAIRQTPNGTNRAVAVKPRRRALGMVQGANSSAIA
jgi:hypothetical protein